jgi:AraC-like DNA-binding protein
MQKYQLKSQKQNASQVVQSDLPGFEQTESLLPVSDLLSFAPPGDPFSLEYVKRTGPFTMETDHYHDYYEMYYMISGERHYFIRDRSYHIRKGDLVFISTRELHKTSDAGSPEHERLVIYFHDSFLRQSYNRHAELLLSPFRTNNPVCRFQMKDQLTAERLIAEILEDMRERAPGYEIGLKHGITELLLLAARHAITGRGEIAPIGTPLHQKMSDIVRYMNHHYAEPLNLSRLAGQFHISPYYLSRMFSKVIGLTISEYLNLTRVKAAELLLKETGKPVTEVALAVGYDNFSHFGKMFKKITKLSPRAYRKG